MTTRVVQLWPNLPEKGGTARVDDTFVEYDGSRESLVNPISSAGWEVATLGAKSLVTTGDRVLSIDIDGSALPSTSVVKTGEVRPESGDNRIKEAIFIGVAVGVVLRCLFG